MRARLLLLTLPLLLSFVVLVAVPAQAAMTETFGWCNYVRPGDWWRSTHVINAKFWFQVQERAPQDYVFVRYLPEKGHELLTEGFHESTTFTVVSEKVQIVDPSWARFSADIEVHGPDGTSGQAYTWTVTCTGDAFL